MEKNNPKSSLVRIGVHDHETLRQLAEQTGLSMQYLLSQAVEWLRREYFFKQLDQAYRDSGQP